MFNNNFTFVNKTIGFRCLESNYKRHNNYNRTQEISLGNSFLES